MRDVSFRSPPRGAIAIGATTPVPSGGVGAQVWSTSVKRLLSWNGARWSVDMSGADLAQLGGVDDDLDASRTANGAALADAISASAGGKRLRIPKTSTGAYRVPTSSLYYLNDCVIDVDAGVRLKGQVQVSPGCRVLRPFWIDYADGTLSYSFRIEPTANLASDNFPIQIAAQTLNRIEAVAVDCSVMRHRQLSTTSDTFAADGSVSSADANSVARNITNDSLWHVSTTSVRGAMRVDAAFSAGTFVRCAFVLTTKGWHMVYASNGAATRQNRQFGSAVAVEGTIDWVGRATTQHMQGHVARWSIRVYDVNTWSVLLNGVEIMLPQTVAGDIIEAGFGVWGNAALTGVTTFYPTREVETEPAGKTGLKILVDGDSTADPATYHGLNDAIREALDGLCGIRVLQITNRAVSGDNSGSVLTRLQNQGTGGANYIVVKVCRNDIQYAMALATTISNLTNIISTARAAFAEPIICIPGAWYLKAETPGGALGQATQNSAGGALARQAILQLCAKQGVAYYEEEFYHGPILPDYLTGFPDSFDQRVRDNIHQTGALYRLDGFQIARAIAGHYLHEQTQAFAPRALPTLDRPECGPKNGWTYANAKYEMDAAGLVQFIGYANVGTIADGTSIFQLPWGMYPADVRRFKARTSNAGRDALVDVLTDGTIRIYNLDGTITYVTLDALSWRAA